MKNLDNTLEKFLASYIETALWSSMDTDGTPLDNSKYAEVELAGETRDKMRADCQAFNRSIQRHFRCVHV